MPDANDMELVREFARQNSETAFAGLVRRHINLVYSVAVRFTGNPGDAEDVTQAVFILLARKAAGLSDRTVLTGWLYETTRLTAAGFLRSQNRRRFWEQEAFMQSNLNAPVAGDLWRQLAPHLEAAMSRLAERDRTLLALRFYENKTGAEAAALMGIRAEAAHKRTARALEKLRSFFAKRGVDSTASAIAENISAHSIQVAPVALAKTVTTVAVAKGAAASVSTLTLINGALKIMAWTKAKAAIVVTVGVLLAAGTTTITVNEMHQLSLEDKINWRPDQATLEQQPPVALIRPTKNVMTGSNGKLIPMGGADIYIAIPSGKMMAINTDMRSLLRFACDGGRVDRQFIWVGDEPTNRFDAIYTLGPGKQIQLQQVIRKKTGWSAKLEDREVDTLALKVKTTDAPGLKPSDQTRGTGRRGGPGGESAQGVTMAIVARILSHDLLVPVVDQTGLPGRFDYQLDLDPRKSLEEKKQIVLDQLGLDLVPTGEKQLIKVLVAQKVKWHFP
jgi:uncharacterized protein (TIGR03435 family)